MKRRAAFWRRALVLGIGFAALCLTPARADVDQAERATVRIAVIAESPDGKALFGTGSGFVVAPNMIVTNAHVVAAARQHPEMTVTVVPSQGEGMLPARIVRYSTQNDLALLQLESGPDIAPIIVSTFAPRPGDAIVALGYPDVDDLRSDAAELVKPVAASRTSGSIASLRDRAPTGDPLPTINHEAAISSGSSGGPLVDECGRVIGVNTWHARGAETGEARSVATRASVLLDFLQASGVRVRVTDDRCLSLAERVQAEQTQTADELERRNRQLENRLDTADKLISLAFVILFGGAVALLAAVCVLGAALLSVRRAKADGEAPKSALGVVAIVAGSAAAAIIIAFGLYAYFRLHALPEHALHAPPKSETVAK